MKLDTNILDELIDNCPEILTDFQFYIPNFYTDYPKKYKGFKVIRELIIDDNSFYFGRLSY